MTVREMRYQIDEEREGTDGIKFASCTTRKQTISARSVVLHSDVMIAVNLKNGMTLIDDADTEVGEARYGQHQYQQPVLGSRRVL